MKRILPILFIFNFIFFQSSSVEADITFSFQANKNVGLLNFVESISGFGHRPQLLRDVFEKSAFNNEKYRALIVEFKNSYQKNSGSFNFKHGAESRHNRFDVHKFFHVQNALSSNLDDLQVRTLGLFPYDVHHSVFKVLKEFEPVYDALFWKELGKETVAKAQALETFANENNATGFLKDVETFYQSKWPEEVPFNAILYPIARKSKRSSTEHIGPLLSFASVLEDKNFVSITGVLVHEVTHAIFASQEDAIQKKLEKSFIEHKSPYRFLAYKYLDEGVATAIGNGIFVRNLTGTYPNSLYSDKYINGYGKKLIPIIDEYLKNKKAWDQNFVDAAIKAFSEEFSDSYRNIEILMNQNQIYIQSPLQEIPIQDMAFG